MRFGEALRKAREARGLSREQLRMRIRLYFEKPPSLSAIRELENGGRLHPHKRHEQMYRAVLTIDFVRECNR